MSEEFLHYLWKYRLFIPPLETTTGEPIVVIKTGTHNPDAGPDFVDARLRIGDTLWAGNVEIHLQSSAWYGHRHDANNAYDNVILHVVLDNDKPAIRSNGQTIPCLECSKLIPDSLYDKYKGLMSSRLWVPCARIIRFCPEIIVNSCIESQLVERLANRALALGALWKSANNDWEETFYCLLARTFGLKINTLPFELLAMSLPHKIVSRHRDQPLQVDALLFGQAGFLEDDIADDYPSRLKKEYGFLRKKYALEPLDASVWKFMRLRPPAFPTIRLAQFSALMQRSSALFSLMLETTEIEKLKALFKVEAGTYWDDHFRIDKKSTISNQKVFGDQSIDLLLINAVVPMLFYYGKHYHYEEFTQRAFNLLEQLPPEQNAIVNKWQSLGINIRDAFSSQALLNLKQSYCDQKRCLHCRIGNELLK